MGGGRYKVFLGLYERESGRRVRARTLLPCKASQAELPLVIGISP